MTTVADDLFQQAIDVAKAVSDTQEKIVARQAKDRRNNRILAASLLFDLLITGGLALNGHQTCVQGNQFRAGQVRLWDHIIAVSKAPPGETAAARAARLATLAAFRSYIAGQFRPVDCARPSTW